MSGRSEGMERECMTFTRYLIGVLPEAYVKEKYAAAQTDAEFTARGRFDTLLMRVARSGLLGAKLTDAYARVFAPRSLLRKKLVLLLAILETCAPSFHLIDDLDSRSRTVLLLRMSARAAGSMIALLAAAPLLLPVQLGLASIERER